MNEERALARYAEMGVKGLTLTIVGLCLRGHKHRDIAEMLGISVATVSRRLQRVRVLAAAAHAEDLSGALAEWRPRWYNEEVAEEYQVIWHVQQGDVLEQWVDARRRGEDWEEVVCSRWRRPTLRTPDVTRLGERVRPERGVDDQGRPVLPPVRVFRPEDLVRRTIDILGGG